MSEDKIHFDKVIVPFKIYASMKGKIKEQKEEIERLNNTIKEVNKLLNTLEEINENYKVEDTDSLYSKKWLRETIEEMRKVINGRNE